MLPTETNTARPKLHLFHVHTFLFVNFSLVYSNKNSRSYKLTRMIYIMLDLHLSPACRDSALTFILSLVRLMAIQRQFWIDKLLISVVINVEGCRTYVAIVIVGANEPDLILSLMFCDWLVKRDVRLCEAAPMRSLATCNWQFSQYMKLCY